MKTLKFNLIAIIILLFGNLAKAQESKKEINLLELPEVYISEGVSLFFISPEPIQFVDLSTNSLVGDLPAENVSRVKIKGETDLKEIELNLKNGQKSLGVITVVGQSFMAQYRTVYRKIGSSSPTTNIQIQPDNMQPLEFPKIGFSYVELKKLSMTLFEKRIRTPLRKNKKFKVKLQLNNAYVYNDYIFLDVGVLNKSNIKYSIESIKFSIDDKKIYKATNNQSVTLHPVFRLFLKKQFRRRYRNIFVFKKFTFPNGKVLNIRLLENPVSGRTVELKVKYSDILKADVF